MTTDMAHDYQEEDTDTMTNIFQGCLRLKGFIWTALCLPCACLGCGPTVIVPEGQRAAVLKYGKLVRIVPPGTYHRNIGTEEFRLCTVAVITLEIPSQRVMTRDNVSVVLDAVCFLPDS